MTKRVVITGLGAISSIGIGKNDFWENLLKGKSGISPITAFDTSNHFVHNGGQVKNFDPLPFMVMCEEELPTMNRATQMAVASAKLASNDAGISTVNMTDVRMGVSHGTTLGATQAIEDIDQAYVKRQEIDKRLLYQLPPHTSPAAIAKVLGCRGPQFMVSTACSAGNYAIAYAYDLIRLGQADIMLAGGSDAISLIEYTGFNQLHAIAPDKCQPFDKNRKGMIPGEGAATLVLESLENAVKRNAHIYAEILGYGLSCDASHMTLAAVDGIIACMKKAVHEAGIKPEDVGYISAHGTGTPANDRAESAAVKSVFGAGYRSVPVSSIKSMLGHTMGAASALEAIACSLIIENGVIPPTINYETPDPECDIDCVPNFAREHEVSVLLNNSYAFGGNNASLVMAKYRD